MQLSLFDIQQPKIELEELFTAYFECRKNKRNTANALAFEIDYENNLVQLCEEINSGTYKIGRSIAFIVDKPVKREIFAADFRDRVVHHLIIGKLNHLFEKQFINDSYSCRVDKGTHFGIQRIDRFIRQCSVNYTKDCYILKLDLQGFFMSINKNILFAKLETFINEKHQHSDKDLIIKLCKQVIFNDPTKNCIIKGNKSDWTDLQTNLSLNADGNYDQAGYNELNTMARNCNAMGVTHTVLAAGSAVAAFFWWPAAILVVSNTVAAAAWYDANNYINNSLDYNQALFLGAYHTQETIEYHRFLFWKWTTSKFINVPDAHDGFASVKSQYLAVNKGRNVIIPPATIKNVNHMEEFNHKNTRIEFNNAIVEGGYGNGIFKK